MIERGRMFRFSPRPNRAHLVKWRPWGAEAFQEAQQQDKPLVLWLTAFWCGYCQRMDDTTLSHDEVIALLNAFFIPIRVEESQRPDVDLRYNQNGWPTIAFLTPAGDDILRVNYLDPEPFISLLVRLVDAYQRDKVTMLETAARNRSEAQQHKADAVPAPLGCPLWRRSLACWKGSLTMCMAATARKRNFCIRKPTISCSTSLASAVTGRISTMWRSLWRRCGRAVPSTTKTAVSSVTRHVLTGASRTRKNSSTIRPGSYAITSTPIFSPSARRIKRRPRA